jgi:hypothetical protein
MATATLSPCAPGDFTTTDTLLSAEADDFVAPSSSVTIERLAGCTSLISMWPAALVDRRSRESLSGQAIWRIHVVAIRHMRLRCRIRREALHSNGTRLNSD